MTKRFEDKVGIVTGGGTGIGLATAQRFVAEGGKAVVVGRRAHVLASAAAVIDPTGAQIATLSADVGQVATAAQVMARQSASAGSTSCSIMPASSGQSRFSITPRRTSTGF